MKASEILAALFESRTDPFPITKISTNEWLIDTGGLSDIFVNTEIIKERELTLMHISFRSESGFSANNQMGSAANRVLWSVVSVVESEPKPDLYIFYPADEDEKILAKKSSIYGKMVLMLRRANKVYRSGAQTYSSFNVKVFWAMPFQSGASSLSDNEVVLLIEDAVASKLS